jgi:hypothetical protein
MKAKGKNKIAGQPTRLCPTTGWTNSPPGAQPHPQGDTATQTHCSPHLTLSRRQFQIPVLLPVPPLLRFAPPRVLPCSPDSAQCIAHPRRILVAGVVGALAVGGAGSSGSGSSPRPIPPRNNAHGRASGGSTALRWLTPPQRLPWSSWRYGHQSPPHTRSSAPVSSNRGLGFCFIGKFPFIREICYYDSLNNALCYYRTPNVNIVIIGF